MVWPDASDVLCFSGRWVIVIDHRETTLIKVITESVLDLDAYVTLKPSLLCVLQTTGGTPRLTVRSRDQHHAASVAADRSATGCPQPGSGLGER